MSIRMQMFTLGQTLMLVNIYYLGDSEILVNTLRRLDFETMQT